MSINKLIDYKYGFYSKIPFYKIYKGLNANIILFISRMKLEPIWMTKWRLESLYIWNNINYPKWANIHHKYIDFNNISYYSSPKKNFRPYDKIDPIFLTTFDKLGISSSKHSSIYAMDIVFDSVSITTTFIENIKKQGIIFSSLNESIINYPYLVKIYIGTVVSIKDNFYASLNSSVFSDGSFCYIPKCVLCKIELSTYFRINEKGIGQFERTLIIADNESYVSYLEGCTAPQRNENQLHAAVVELISLVGSEIKYSTIQNWYPGDTLGKGGVFNFVTKRGVCENNAKIYWIQLETGSSITWKYPSCILKGDNSMGEFYSVSLTKNFQQVDTGTKMIHFGKNTNSSIISKSITYGKSRNSFRGLVKISKKSINSRNFSQCDSLLLGNDCSVHTFPKIEVKNNFSHVEHEATTSKIGEDQIFYCNQRGLSTEQAISIIIHGFIYKILNKLPMEFSVEASKLLEITLVNSVG
jgi:Fe-S cluster assembly protein SufB